MEKKTTFFLVDEHAIFRSCVRCLLEQEKNLVWVGEAGNGCEAIKKVKECQPDLVLMEPFLPKLSGSSVISAIKRSSPHTQFIVLSAHESEAHIRTAFEAGARAYCTKNSDSGELMSAIQAVVAGRIYLSPEIMSKVLTDVLDAGRPLDKKAS